MNGVIEYLNSPWGIRPELLLPIARYARGEISATEAREEIEPPETAGTAGITGSGVAVIPLRGMITPSGSILSILFGGGGGLQAFRSSLREALASDEVASILIDVDSPGGVVDLVPETAADIRAAKAKKPVTAIANTMAASAAYWLAAQADELVVTPSGDVGSIGVYILHEEISKLDERIGFTTTLIKSGKYKAEGNPWKPLTEEAKEHFQERCDEVYDMFIADVAKGRGVAASAVRSGFGEGRIISAKNAVSMGMADRVDTFEGTVTRLVRGSDGGRRAEETSVTEDSLATGDQELLAQVHEQLETATQSLKKED